MTPTQRGSEVFKKRAKIADVTGCLKGEAVKTCERPHTEKMIDTYMDIT